MSLQNIANCSTCGKIFVRGISDICPACYKEIDKQFDVCIKYLRENKRCTIQELSEETGVQVRQISKFIREGKLSLKNAPNMSYPCEVCGSLIRESHICDHCRQKLAKDIKNLNEDNERKQEMQKEEGKLSYNIQDRLKDRR